MCENITPFLSDLVPFHSEQVRNLHLIVLGQVNGKLYSSVFHILINYYEPADLDLHCLEFISQVSFCFQKSLYIVSAQVYGIRL